MECLLCKGKGQTRIPLCRPCQKELPWHHSECIAFKYKAPIDHWITNLKFHYKLEYTKLLGILFAEKIKKSELPELIIPIPLHTWRLCKRGFNQSLEIAKHISRDLKIPLNCHALKRIKHTKPQSELDEKEREKNLLGAFHCVKKIHAHHVAIFDDVVTTGSTLNAAYEALKENGVSKIERWCCASTQKIKITR